MISNELLQAILKGRLLSPWGIHGLSHWARVLENGRRLAAANGAILEVVELFAVLHDARRQNDAIDPGHGRRGAALAASFRGSLIQLSDADFDVLYHACAYHTDGTIDGNVTVRTCWDADRLDLFRVGIYPDPAHLATNTGCDPEVIRWAVARSIDPATPQLVAQEWGLTPD